MVVGMSRKKSWLCRYGDEYLMKELESRGYVIIKMRGEQ